MTYRTLPDIHVEPIDPRSLPDARLDLLHIHKPGGSVEAAEFRRLEHDHPDLPFPRMAQMARSITAWSRTALQQARLWHVTADLCDVIGDAMETVPDDFEAVADAPIHPYGMVVFDRPFYGQTADDSPHDVRVDGFVWGPVRIPPYDAISSGFNHVRDAWGLLSLRYIRPDDTDDIATMFPGSSNMWIPLGRVDWPIGDRLDAPPNLWVAERPATLASMIEDRQLMTSVWALAREQHVVDVTQVRPDRAAQRRVRRDGGAADQAEVRVVSLRRHAPPPVDTEKEAEEGRRMKVRYMVRSHWRNQACGEGRQQRRLILVPAHIRGPAGAPFAKRETVYRLDKEAGT